MRYIFLSLALFFTEPAFASEFFVGEQEYLQGNYEKAKAVFRPLIERGHSGAETMTGIMYLRGEGYFANASIAATWFYKASRKGNHNAQLILGTQYLYGLGVKYNASKAYFWLTLASRSAQDRVNNQAVIFLKRSIKKLTSTEITTTKKEIESWYSVKDNFN